MEQALIETVLGIIATLATTLIGVFGAWLIAKIGQNEKLKSIKSATEQVILAAQTTVGELNQTVVSTIKQQGLKLTAEQIADLKDKLLMMAFDKISLPTINLLEAAAVDVNALITGAGEDFIDTLNHA